jgi:hypothetical protein
MKKIIGFGLIVTALFCSNLKSQAKKTANNLNNMYELVSETPKPNIEYELIQHGEIRRENASMGDLLSRMWGHFGKPQIILYEGYEYNIKDKKTGLDFIVSYGAFGPAFYAEKLNVEKIKPVVIMFEKFLDHSQNVDCEIEVETDFGIYLCGAKNGIPYDTPKNGEQADQFSIGSSGNEVFDNLITKLKESMENPLKHDSLLYKSIGGKVRDIPEDIHAEINIINMAN